MKMEAALPLICGGECRWSASGERSVWLLEFLRNIAGLPEGHAAEADRDCMIGDDILPEPTPVSPCGYRLYGQTDLSGRSLLRLDGLRPDSEKHCGIQAKILFFRGLLPRLLLGELFLIHGALARCNGDGVIFCGPSGIGKSTTVGRLPPEWEVLADDCLLLSRKDGLWFAQPVPTWSIWISGKPKRAFNCTDAVQVSRICLLERGEEAILPLTHQEARLGLASAFSDMLSWQFPDNLSSIRARTMRAAFDGMSDLAADIHPVRLRLSLYGEFWELL